MPPIRPNSSKPAETKLEKVCIQQRKITSLTPVSSGLVRIEVEKEVVRGKSKKNGKKQWKIIVVAMGHV